MNKITDKDLANRGVKGLPDVPGLTTEEMQRKLEEIAREILVPKVNEIIDNLIAVNSNLNKLTPVYGSLDATTDTYGRAIIITGEKGVYLLKAWISGESHICVPYVYRTSSVSYIYVKVLNSITMEPVANTKFSFNYYVIDTN